MGALDVVATDRLAALEQQIELGRHAVGAALAEVQADRLYLLTHATFEAYCQERWTFSPRRARQLIQAADVMGTMVPIEGCPLPTNERQARALAAAPPEDRADVMAAVVGKGKPTAAAIAAEVEARHPKPAPPLPPTPPVVGAEASRKVCKNGCGTVLDPRSYTAEGLCADCFAESPTEAPQAKPPTKRDWPDVQEQDRLWQPLRLMGRALKTMPSNEDILRVLPADAIESFDVLAVNVTRWADDWKKARKATGLRLVEEAR